MDIRHVLLQIMTSGEPLAAVPALERLRICAVDSLVGTQIADSRESPAAQRVAARVRLLT